MSGGDVDLRQRWGGLLGELHLSLIDPDFLLNLYRQPARFYHNLEHIRACLAELDALHLPRPDHLQIESAIWFHDAIYDGTRHDNEERSTQLAIDTLRAVGAIDPFLTGVRELILATKHMTTPTAENCRLIVDIDLSILGQRAEIFDRYEKAIRQEYAHVPDDAFRIGRSKVLRAFTDREKIFCTRIFQSKYEAAARENIQRSLNHQKRHLST